MKTLNKILGAFARRGAFGQAVAIALILLTAAVLVPPPIQAQVAARDASAAFLKEVTFASSAAYTATGNSSVIDLGAYDVGNIIVNITAVTGTSPTLTVNFQVCADNACAISVNHTSSSSLTTTGQTLLKVNQFARYVRVNYTIGGTTPSFTMSIYGAFKPTT